MRTIIVIAGLILPLTLSAQFRIGVNLGYGSNRQKDLTNYMIDMRNNLDVDAKITESFPAYFNANVNAYHIATERLNWGVSLAWGATGARISYKDFSGSITNDMLLSYYAFGIPVGYVLNPQSKWKFTAEFCPYYTITTVNATYMTTIGNNNNGDKLSWSSLNISVQPALYVSREFGRFGIHLKSGYNIAWLKGPLNDGYTNLSNRNEEVRVDWNGYRIEGGVSIFLGRPLVTSEE